MDMLRRLLEIHRTLVPPEMMVQEAAAGDHWGAIMDLGRQEMEGEMAFRTYFTSDQNGTNILLSISAPALAISADPPTVSSPDEARHASPSPSPSSTPQPLQPPYTGSRPSRSGAPDSPPETATTPGEMANEPLYERDDAAKTDKDPMRVYVLEVGHIDCCGKTDGTFSVQGKESCFSPEMQLIWRLYNQRKDRTLSGGATNLAAKAFLDGICTDGALFMQFLTEDLMFPGFDHRQDYWSGAMAALSFLSGKRVIEQTGRQIDQDLRWQFQIDGTNLHLLHLAAQRDRGGVAEGAGAGAGAQEGGGTTAATSLEALAECISRVRGGQQSWFSLARLCVTKESETVENFVHRLTSCFQVQEVPGGGVDAVMDEKVKGFRDRIRAGRTIIAQLIRPDPLQRGTAAAEEVLHQLTRLIEARPIRIRDEDDYMMLRARKAGWPHDHFYVRVPNPFATSGCREEPDV
ncbi:unnamed protein product [Vitrella brassicaformis CCMP3155]|uniref:Uncharacterized protein n=1 Tax=Vitrella brassicaformis (strain CCMP3155) TaxID=1169540 RepID=A0A0G4FE60_VITBC|nr:unnamed protein product [Vitrella brassicaformis CCMP3155]|eukprot:CEM11489.1 unnamed protein product [Vitrella brassicaformis CCMP3155]